MDLGKCCSHMETLISHPARGPSESPAAGTRWVLLNPQLERRAKDDSSAADANTAAACCTSWGQTFTVSFGLAAPPARSSFYCRCLDGTPENDNDDDGSMNLSIIAAQDDCIFMTASVPSRCRGYSGDSDYFLYETSGAARLPSLRPLPGCYFSWLFERYEDAGNVATLRPNTRFLAMDNTGILRLGDGEVLITTLEITYDSPYDTAELCVLRTGGEWALKRVLIVHHECPSCERSRFAFNVTTWTLTLRTDGPMTWVKDGVVDRDEIWQLPNYGCLPRVALQYPIVSSDNSDVICFMLDEDRHIIENADETVWFLEIDIKSKALLSFVHSDFYPYFVYSQLSAKFYR
ncbi:unnamed protein product [Urochloa decumbens]|uniref:DUF1618 domain-containing protein n=1 Tax=Urochloa decumbens TaxID=240449 RepID=A0ABC9AN98_9POAL